MVKTNTVPQISRKLKENLCNDRKIGFWVQTLVASPYSNTLYHIVMSFDVAPQSGRERQIGRFFFYVFLFLFWRLWAMQISLASEGRRNIADGRYVWWVYKSEWDISSFEMTSRKSFSVSHLELLQLHFDFGIWLGGQSTKDQSWARFPYSILACRYLVMMDESWTIWNCGENPKVSKFSWIFSLQWIIIILIPVLFLLSSPTGKGKGKSKGKSKGFARFMTAACQVELRLCSVSVYIWIPFDTSIIYRLWTSASILLQEMQYSNAVRQNLISHPSSLIRYGNEEGDYCAKYKYWHHYHLRYKI